MNNVRQNVGAPAPKQDTFDHPFVFEWYENHIEKALSYLHKEDRGQRQKIVEIMEELKDSNLFWKLWTKYDDVMFLNNDNEDVKREATLAFLARIYIAGAHRGFTVLD